MPEVDGMVPGMAPKLFSELAGHPVRWQAEGTIAAPAVDVAGLLLAIRPGRIGHDNALALSDLPAARNGELSLVPGPAPGSFQVAGAGEAIELAVDPLVPALAVRAWCGGIHTIEPAGAGCRVVHRVHWLHPDHQQNSAGIEARMGSRLEQVLLVIADRLGLGSRTLAAGFDIDVRAVKTPDDNSRSAR